jgi:hypothetical protein
VLATAFAQCFLPCHSRLPRSFHTPSLHQVKAGREMQRIEVVGHFTFNANGTSTRTLATAPSIVAEVVELS